eukprot:SM000207S06160  [mRNA]  locus=s207:56470:58960:+ [translate_table: standard]
MDLSLMQNKHSRLLRHWAFEMTPTRFLSQQSSTYDALLRCVFDQLKYARPDRSEMRLYSVLEKRNGKSSSTALPRGMKMALLSDAPCMDTAIQAPPNSLDCRSSDLWPGRRGGVGKRGAQGRRAIGFLTNCHVAVDIGQPRQRLYHPLPPSLGPGVYLGAVELATSFASDHSWYGIFAGQNPETFVRVDGAFIPFNLGFDYSRLTTHLKGIGQMGPVYSIDLASPISRSAPCATAAGESSSSTSLPQPAARLPPRCSSELLPLTPSPLCRPGSVIGQQVSKVGRSSGVTHGVLMGYAVEYNDDKGMCFFTDFLILGENKHPFDLEGDSGSLILLDPGSAVGNSAGSGSADEAALARPFGIIWGGTANRGRVKLRSGHGPENWTSGVDLGRLLDLLELDLISAPEELKGMGPPPSSSIYLPPSFLHLPSLLPPPPFASAVRAALAEQETSGAGRRAAAEPPSASGGGGGGAGSGGGGGDHRSTSAAVGPPAVTGPSQIKHMEFRSDASGTAARLLTNPEEVPTYSHEATSGGSSGGGDFLGRISSPGGSEGGVKRPESVVGLVMEPPGGSSPELALPQVKRPKFDLLR